MMKYLIFLLFPLSLFASENITGNLIINSTFENNNANGWTASGNGQVISDCCGSSYDYEFGDAGSIEQSFGLTSDSVTQQMLNNGITLNSSVLVQNGECAVAGCWGGSGDADSFTIRLRILDANSNVLSESSQTRYDTTSINGSDFVNSVSYSGVESNIGNIKISGTDSNAPAYLGAGNIDNVVVRLTYDDTVLTAIQTTQLNTTVEEIQQTLFLPKEIMPEFETLFIEEITLQPFEEPEIIKIYKELFIEEISTKEISTGIINVFEEPKFIEAVETTELPAENLYEEIKTTEIEITEQPIQETAGTENAELPEQGEGRVAEEPRTEEQEKVEEASVGVESQPEESNVVEQVNTTETRTAETDIESNENTESDTVEVADDQNINENQNEETVSESAAENNINVSVDKVIDKIDKLSISLDKKLAMTSTIIAKAMTQNNKAIDSYSEVNNNLYNEQRVMDGGNYGQTRSYTDTRNIYAKNQNFSNGFKNKVSESYKRIDEAVKNRIIAEEHLRSIRGF